MLRKVYAIKILELKTNSYQKLRLPVSMRAIRQALAKYGWQIPVILFERIYDLAFDKYNSTDTVALARLEHLDVGVAGQKIGNQYQPSGILLAKRVLNEMKKYGKGGFVDFGSGKGQVLLVASQKGFHPVKGIEFSETLHKIAESNIDRYCLHRPEIIKPVSICTDAALYNVNPEDQFFYLFNPFKEEVLTAVAQNIVASTRQFPRKVYVFYLFPKYKYVFEEMADFKKVNEIRLSGYDCCIYTTIEF